MADVRLARPYSAHDVATEHGQKTITAAHVLEASKQLGWDDQQAVSKYLKSELSGQSSTIGCIQLHAVLAKPVVACNTRGVSVLIPPSQPSAHPSTLATPPPRPPPQPPPGTAYRAAVEAKKSGAGPARPLRSQVAVDPATGTTRAEGEEEAYETDSEDEAAATQADEEEAEDMVVEE